MKFQLAILITLFAAITSAAQRPTGPRPTPRPASPASPFDISAARLSPGFKGHDPAAVIEALADLQGKVGKSEFETSAEYLSRLKEMNKVPLYGSVHPDSLLAFALSEEMSAEAFRYDADKKYFVGKLDTGGRVELFTELSKAGKFIGQNAFGVKVRVADVEMVTGGLKFSRDGALTENGFERGYSMRFDMDAKTAFQKKPGMRMLIIGRLSNLRIGFDTDVKEATIAAPTKLTKLDLSMHFIVKEIWAYSITTGEIFGKLTQAAIDKGREFPILQ